MAKNWREMFDKMEKGMAELKNGMAQKENDIVGLKEQIAKLQEENRGVKRKIARIQSYIPEAKKLLIGRGLPTELVNESFAALPLEKAFGILMKMPNSLLARNVRKMLNHQEWAIKANKWNDDYCLSNVTISENGLVLINSTDAYWASLVDHLQNFLNSTRQQGEMTDSSENSNGNQRITAVGDEQLLLEPSNATALLNDQLDCRNGRKRAANSNAGELLSLVNGIPNFHYKARKEDNELENGEADETRNNDEIVAMECSMNKKGQQQLETSTSVAAVANGGNGMLDLFGRFNTMIQAQIAVTKSQKEAADLQKLAAAELQQAGKSINEMLPKVHAVLEKLMERGSKN